MLYTPTVDTYDAGAMNTRPEERLPYLELARQGARMSRSLPAEALSRLADIAPGHGALQIDLAFTLDAEGRAWVNGSAALTVHATCQRCLEGFQHGMQVTLTLCIVTDPSLASELAGEADVLVADGDSVSIADVVEDEVILSLPERLCREDPCEYAPKLWFPAPDAPEPEREENPFDVLSVLKQ